MKSNDLTYIGFSVKAGKIIYGINLIKCSKKKKYLMLLCKSASDNTKKAAINYAKLKNIDIYQTKDILLEQAVNKTNCKCAALTDKNLSEAVTKSGYNFIALKEVL